VRAQTRPEYQSKGSLKDFICDKETNGDMKGNR
jgi:hypothetical protein